MSTHDDERHDARDEDLEPSEVCSHGETSGDCDVCSHGRAIDAYDMGLLDD